MPGNAIWNKATLILLAWVGCGTNAHAVEPVRDPLWKQAVAVASANADWVPGLTVTVSEVLRKGEVVGTHEMRQRSRLGSKGEVVKEMVAMLEDGKEVTREEEPKDKRKDETKNAAGSWAGNPFEAGVQDRVTLRVLDEPRTVGERPCVGYAFELRNPQGPLVKGTAWLDRQSGVPAEVEGMTFDPLPDKRLKRLSLTTRYEATTNGLWLPRTTTASSTMSLFFIKVDTRTTMSFSDYWKKPPRETLPANQSPAAHADP